jgi:hypothetical protein
MPLVRSVMSIVRYVDDLGISTIHCRRAGFRFGGRGQIGGRKVGRRMGRACESRVCIAEISVEWRGRIKGWPICWRYCAVSGPLRAGNGQRDASIGVTRLDQAQRLMLNLLADRSGAAKIGRKATGGPAFEGEERRTIVSNIAGSGRKLVEGVLVEE